MRNILLQNLPLKLIALVLSLVLFLVVRADKATVVSLEVPLMARVPQGFVLVNEPLAVIRVQLKGKWSKLKDLRAEDLGTLSVSARAATGRSTHAFMAEQLRLPPGTEIVGFEPPSIVLALEEETTRRVPVAIDRALSASPLAGYLLGEVAVEPDHVEIVGPRSEVEMVNQVFMEPIDLSGRSRTFTEERFVVPDRRGVEVRGPGRVKITVEIVPRARERVVAGVPVLVLNLTTPFEVLPSSVDLVLVGEDVALEKVDPTKLVVTLDGGELQGQPDLSVQMTVAPVNVYNLPPDVGVDTARLPNVFVRTRTPKLLVPAPPLGPALPDGDEPNQGPGDPAESKPTDRPAPTP